MVNDVMLTQSALPLFEEDVRKINPLRLYRWWKAAAGPVAGPFVPAAPFTALAQAEVAASLRLDGLNLTAFDKLCRQIAERLALTEQFEAVRDGQAAFVLDLPGMIGLGLAFHLQAIGIGPVLAWGGLYRPASLLEGTHSLSALIHYGHRLAPWAGQIGLAFVLERERRGPSHLDDLTLWATFDNRYHAGEHLLPPLNLLRAAGLTSLIDLRPENDSLPEDLDYFLSTERLRLV